MTATVIAERSESIAPLIARHSLWKMIEKSYNDFSGYDTQALTAAKEVWDSDVSSLEDYIAVTHQLKKDYADENKISKVELNTDDFKMKLGTQVNLTAVVETDKMGLADNRNIVWSSNDTDVIDIDEYGMVTAKGIGEAKVTASVDGAKSDSCTITVGKYLIATSPAVIESISSDTVLLEVLSFDDDFSAYDIVFVGSTGNIYIDLYKYAYNLELFVLSSNNQLLVSAFNTQSTYTQYLSILTKGKDVGVAIRFKDAGVYHNGVVVDEPTNFTNSLQELVGGDYSKFFENGDVEKEVLSHYVETFSNLIEVDYTKESWDPFADELADAQEMLTDVSVEDPVITKEDLAAMAFDLKEARWSLIPINSISEISIESGLSLSVGNSQKLDPKIKDSNKVELTHIPVTWSSDNTTVATVSKSGTITARSAGIANITATAGGKSSVCEVSVTIPINSLILSSSKEIIEMDGESLTLTAIVSPINANYEKDTIAWSSADTSIATIVDGVVTPVSPGRTTITVSVDIKENVYDASAGTVSVVTTTKTAECEVIVKAIKSERVGVLYIGEADLVGLQDTVDSMYYCGYFDYSFISGYNADSTVTDELLNLDFSEYDVVYFGMFGDYDQIKEALQSAQETGTKVISLETETTAPTYFNASFPSAEVQDISLLYHYYRQLLSLSKASTASMLWGEKFLIQSAIDYAPASKIPQELADEEPLKILYIGSQASNFEDVAKIFSQGAYGDAVSWPTFLKNGETFSADIIELFDLDDINNPETLNKIASINNQIASNDYDIIICDGFAGYDDSTSTDTHFTYLVNIISKSNDATDPAIIVLLNKELKGDGEWNSAATVLGISASNYLSVSDEMTFETSTDELKMANRFLFGLVNTYGHERAKTWIYTDDSISVGSVFYAHPLPGGADRLKFSTLDAYLTWATKNGYFDPDRPTVGIWGFPSDLGPGMDSLVFELENQGVNVILGLESYNDIPKYYTWTDENGTKKQIDAAISIKNFGLNYWNYSEGLRQLEEMDIAVLKGIFSSSDYKTVTPSDPSDMNKYIDSSSISRMTLSPNRDGIFDFIVIGYMDQSVSYGYSDQIEWMAERAASWAYLKHNENSQKQIALLYYNYPPGKADIGANYLDVISSFSGTDSFEGLLDNMKQTDQYFDVKGNDLGGYIIDYNKLPYANDSDTAGKYNYEYKSDSDSDDDWGKKVMTEENLRRLMWSQGINVGSHAPGVLKGMVQEYTDFIKYNDPEDWWGLRLIPVDDYKLWLEMGALPQVLSDELNETWGTPWEGELSQDQSGMIWVDEDNALQNGAGKRYFVIPCIQVGNVWIMPQPDRALAGTQAIEGDLSSTTSADYHGDMAPTHQYVAFYLWLNEGVSKGDSWNLMEDEWKADAVIHFGTHGTQEWMPGTAVGLQVDSDWGPNLIGRLPNIYPYIVANVGEGLTAEMRGNALIISHLTPAMVRTGLYGDILKLETAMQSYSKHRSVDGDPSIQYEYRKDIVDIIFGNESKGFDGIETIYMSINASYGASVAKAEGIDVSKVNQTVFKDHLLALSDDEFNIFMTNYLHNIIDSIMENSLPLGMHIYGKAPTDAQSARMVREIWGNFRFEELIQELYFEGESIPQEKPLTVGGITYYNGKYDGDVENFVLEYVAGKSEGLSESVVIKNALESTLEGDDDQRFAVEFFIRGPIMFYEDAKASGNYNNLEDLQAYVLQKWIEHGVEDIVIDELCTDFIPNSVMGSKLTESGSTVNAFDETKFNNQFRTFVNETVKLLEENAALSEDKQRTSEQIINGVLTECFNVNGYADQTWINQGVMDYILAYGRDSYAESLMSCGQAETQALLSALSGGYISVTTGNDPIQNPAVLPTGRNFYGIDPDTFPTRAAWEVGQAMGEQLLVSYYEEYGTWPDTVSFMRFGVEYIRDEGALEACIYYLLGCEPEWSGNQYTGTGTFKGGKVITDTEFFQLYYSNGTKIEELRPRVDIVYNTAGMRDAYPNALRYIDKAIRDVNALGDSEIQNNVKTNTKAIEDALFEMKKNGEIDLSDDEIKELALSRTFAQQLGTYEIGTGNLVSSSGLWDSDSAQATNDLVNLYISKMGYVYNSYTWGGDGSEDFKKAMEAVLKLTLSKADASVFASSSNLYDSLDNDDVFQYYGVMNLVSQQSRSDGKLPKMYYADTSNVANFQAGDRVISTMQEALMKDLTSRYLNPEWIKAMEDAGYSGSTMMAEFMENLFGWAVVTNGEFVSDELWGTVMTVYLEDNSHLLNNEAFSYAYQSMTGRMLEAVRTDYWNASDDQVKTLVDAYVDSVMDAGVACCHHTCGNPSLNEFILGQMSVLGYTDEEMTSYLEIVQKATLMTYSLPPSDSDDKNISSSSGGGYGMATAVEAGEAASGEASDDGEESDSGDEQNPGVGETGTETGTPTTDVSGFEMTVTNAANSVRDFIQNPTFSSSSIIAIAFVILVVGAIFYGSRRQKL
ncbi:cobaltochelatase subunit CobN [Methanimicrococcus hongohii]|uniref:cobaltochelatase subunit CobN n=1 Tax=Methanimicrococcus hongohii TaxID=3028295 RepID=UPI0029304617|nr:cobaltochelatase subunit CobN [Methanimicrococcus sp. Hf6]